MENRLSGSSTTSGRTARSPRTATASSSSPACSSAAHILGRTCAAGRTLGCRGRRGYVRESWARRSAAATWELCAWSGPRSAASSPCAGPAGQPSAVLRRASRRHPVSPSLERLLAHPDVPGDLNAAALVDHLCHRWPDPANAFRVDQARSCRACSARGRRRSTRRALLGAPTPEDWIEDDELHDFDGLFEEAIMRQLELGPAGIYLSGGFDSVSVAAVATDLAARREIRSHGRCRWRSHTPIATNRTSNGRSLPGSSFLRC